MGWGGVGWGGVGWGGVGWGGVGWGGAGRGGAGRGGAGRGGWGLLGWVKWHELQKDSQAPEGAAQASVCEALKQNDKGQSSSSQ